MIKIDSLYSTVSYYEPRSKLSDDVPEILDLQIIGSV